MVFLFSHPECPVVSLSSASQGYPQALLPLTVAGIPSIHICLDFIPELLAQPQLEKQVTPSPRPPVLELRLLGLSLCRPCAVLCLMLTCMSTQIFAIQLLSQLCTQYALPKSLSVARLAISVMGTLLTGERCFHLLFVPLMYGSLKEDFFDLSVDPCQAVLFLHAHPALPGGLLPGLPAAVR